MGYLREKYTKEYYTGVDKCGKKLNYGATNSFDNKGNYKLRDQDRIILEGIDFDCKNVLALGCGRGEELAYAIENGANVEDTVGVDFSPAAIKICKKVIKDKKLKLPQLYTEDALSFVSRFQKIIKNNKDKKFDIVIMFDFVEHVPRFELAKTLKILKTLIKKAVLIAVNTPAYRYDNDVIKNGYDERNQIGLLDTSDNILETRGMHCNKYSLISLQNFMGDYGFINITEAHYFINAGIAPINFGNKSYYDRWQEATNLNIPIYGEFCDDVIEVPYQNLPDVRLLELDEGNLKGISILITDEYKDAIFHNGNTDVEMMFNVFQLKPLDKIIFDVGTFIGTSAMLFSKMVGKNGKVIGFEPNLFNRNRAFSNLSHNPDLSSKILIYKYALSDENKNQNMILSSNIDIGHSSTSRLKGSHSTIHDADLPTGFEDVNVEVKTLDSFVGETDTLPDIIKVDIEGAEYEFLLGAINTIRKSHPIFYIELHSQFCATKCSELLILEGYLIEVLHEEEDNRLMIKAEYVSDIQSRSIKENNIIMMKTINGIYSSNKNMAENLSDVSKKFSILLQDKYQLEKNISDLAFEKDLLLSKNARMIEENGKLLFRVNDIENSKSWKITKPVRFIAAISRMIIKRNHK